MSTDLLLDGLFISSCKITKRIGSDTFLCHVWNNKSVFYKYRKSVDNCFVCYSNLTTHFNR